MEDKSKTSCLFRILLSAQTRVQGKCRLQASSRDDFLPLPSPPSPFQPRLRLTHPWNWTPPSSALLLQLHPTELVPTPGAGSTPPELASSHSTRAGSTPQLVPTPGAGSTPGAGFPRPRVGFTPSCWPPPPRAGPHLPGLVPPQAPPSVPESPASWPRPTPLPVNCSPAAPPVRAPLGPGVRLSAAASPLAEAAWRSRQPRPEVGRPGRPRRGARWRLGRGLRVRVVRLAAGRGDLVPSSGRGAGRGGAWAVGAPGAACAPPGTPAPPLRWSRWAAGSCCYPPALNAAVPSSERASIILARRGFCCEGTFRGSAVVVWVVTNGGIATGN